MKKICGYFALMILFPSALVAGEHFPQLESELDQLFPYHQEAPAPYPLTGDALPIMANERDDFVGQLEVLSPSTGAQAPVDLPRACSSGEEYEVLTIINMGCGQLTGYRKAFTMPPAESAAAASKPAPPTSSYAVANTPEFSCRTLAASLTLSQEKYVKKPNRIPRHGINAGKTWLMVLLERYRHSTTHTDCLCKQNIFKAIQFMLEHKAQLDISCQVFNTGEKITPREYMTRFMPELLAQVLPVPEEEIQPPVIEPLTSPWFACKTLCSTAKDTSLCHLREPNKIMSSGPNWGKSWLMVLIEKYYHARDHVDCECRKKLVEAMREMLNAQASLDLACKSFESNSLLTPQQALEYFAPNLLRELNIKRSSEESEKMPVPKRVAHALSENPL